MNINRDNQGNIDMAFQIHRLAEKTIFVHQALDDAGDLEGALEVFKDTVPVGCAAWFCTDAEGREGFHIWRAEESYLFDAGVYVAQHGVPELAKLGLSDRFERLRAKLDIKLKGFPVPGEGSGKYADVEFLKSLEWFW
jgi:hypothetical protein